MGKIKDVELIVFTIDVIGFIIALTVFAELFVFPTAIALGSILAAFFGAI